MFEEMVVSRLSVKTLFKLIAVGLLISMGIFGAVMGIAGFFGANTVWVNGVNVYGYKALIMGPVIGISTAILFTLFLGVMIALGLWIYSKFSTITLVTKS